MLKNGKRLPALLLAVMMLLQMMPFEAIAQDKVYSDSFTLQEQMGGAALAAAYTHTASFYEYDGTTLISTVENIPDGTRLSSIAPQAPARTGYTFTRWTPNETYLTAPSSSTFDFVAQYTSEKVYNLNIRYLYEVDDSQAAPPYTGVYTYGDSYSATSPLIYGYELKDPSQATVSGVAGIDLAGSTALDYTVYYVVNTGTPYRVEHYFQALTGSDYLLDTALTQDLLAVSGARVVVNSLTVEGFNALVPSQTVTVAPDGTTVVRLYYDRQVYVITYDTSGGTYVPPFIGRYGTTIPQVPDPVRSGYTFAGWDQTLPQTLTQSWNLTALWTPAPAPYTVIYWQENAYDDGFSFVESVTRTGVTGEMATYEAKTYAGFNLNLELSNNPPVYIQGDGSAVVNVYYSRGRYDVYFLDNNTNHLIRLYEDVKQGMYIISIWDEMHKDYDQYTWYTATNNQEHYTFAPLMPARDLYLYGNAKGSVPYTIYYLENVHNTLIRPPYSFTANSNVKLKSYDYIAFPGFEITSRVGDGSENPKEVPPASGQFEYRLYYNRLSYPLRFYSYNTYLNTNHMVPYDSPLQQYYFSPATPPELPGYTFGGWYTSASAVPGTEVVWSTARMPANELVLYALWVPPTFAVQFVYPIPGDGYGALTPQQVLPGGYAVLPAGPETIPGYTFDGWYYQGTRTPYNFNSRVYGNLILEGSYVPSRDITYTVRYLNVSDGSTVFPDKLVTGQTMDTQVTEDARWPSDYSKVPDLRQKTLTLQAQNNEIIFWYTPNTQAALSYTVRYVEEGTLIQLAQPVSKTADAASVTETAKSILNYPYTMADGRLVYVDFLPDRTQKSLDLTTTPSDNVLTFYYQPLIKYHYYVHYMEAGSDIPLSSERYVVTTHNNVVERPRHRPLSAGQL